MRSLDLRIGIASLVGAINSRWGFFLVVVFFLKKKKKKKRKKNREIIGENAVKTPR